MSKRSFKNKAALTLAVLGAVSPVGDPDLFEVQFPWASRVAEAEDIFSSSPTDEGLGFIGSNWNPNDNWASTTHLLTQYKYQVNKDEWFYGKMKDYTNLSQYEIWSTSPSPNGGSYLFYNRSAGTIDYVRNYGTNKIILERISRLNIHVTSGGGGTASANASPVEYSDKDYDEIDDKSTFYTAIYPSGEVYTLSATRQSVSPANPIGGEFTSVTNDLLEKFSPMTFTQRTVNGTTKLYTNGTSWSFSGGGTPSSGGAGSTTPTTPSSDDSKANVSLDNITDAGKQVIRNTVAGDISAAENRSKTDAQNKANAAQNNANAYTNQKLAEAENRAKADATNKANQAKTDAINDAAKKVADAETRAKNDATTKANAAEANAKADTAKKVSDAESRAKQDATNKANAAQSAAAQDATKRLILPKAMQNHIPTL